VNKADLIDKMATEANISKAAAEKALGALTDGVKTALQKGEPVTLIGFGTYRQESTNGCGVADTRQKGY